MSAVAVVFGLGSILCSIASGTLRWLLALKTEEIRGEFNPSIRLLSQPCLATSLGLRSVCGHLQRGGHKSRKKKLPSLSTELHRDRR